MKKKIMTLTMTLGILLVLSGTAYGYFNYQKTGNNKQLVVGDIYMHFTESNALSLSNAMPSTTYDTNNYFEFSVSGKNTNTKSDIAYSIQVLKGDSIDGKNRIGDKFLDFRLTEVKDSEETILVDNQSFLEINNSSIYQNTISKNTTSEINHTYRLYMKISEEVLIGNTTNADYSESEWSNLYASIKVKVNGAIGEILTSFVKSKLGTEGVVAVDTNGNLYSGTGEIREYRYSGTGNYCTYTDGENDYNLNVEGDTCEPTACLAQLSAAGVSAFSTSNEFLTLMAASEGLESLSCTDLGGTILNLKVENSKPTDSGLRNYIEFNGELWRIIGVFGNNIKIMKDTPLENDLYENTTYTSGDTTYNIKYSFTGVKYGYYVYKQLSDENYNNDWTTSGAMHYLNDETGVNYYTTNLSATAKNMIEPTTYYLGNVSNYDNGYEEWTLQGTASELYVQERSNVMCSSDVWSNSHESNCNIWYGNKATWNGKIGLLYPSDYAYASATENWTKDVNLYHVNGGSSNNWMLNTDAGVNWFLSPSSGYPINVSVWIMVGSLSGIDANNFGAFRPVLNLKSDVIVVSGDGSYNSPYKLLES